MSAGTDSSGWGGPLTGVVVVVLRAVVLHDLEGAGGELRSVRLPPGDVGAAAGAARVGEIVGHPVGDIGLVVADDAVPDSRAGVNADVGDPLGLMQRVEHALDELRVLDEVAGPNWRRTARRRATREWRWRRRRRSRPAVRVDPGFVARVARRVALAAWLIRGRGRIAQVGVQVEPTAGPGCFLRQTWVRVGRRPSVHLPDLHDADGVVTASGSCPHWA